MIFSMPETTIRRPRHRRGCGGIPSRNNGPSRVLDVRLEPDERRRVRLPLLAEGAHSDVGDFCGAREPEGTEHDRGDVLRLDESLRVEGRAHAGILGLLPGSVGLAWVDAQHPDTQSVDLVAKAVGQRLERVLRGSVLT